MRARLKDPSAHAHGSPYRKALAGRIGWTLFVSDLLARAQALAPLDELHLDGLAQFAAPHVGFSAADLLLSFADPVPSPLIQPGDASTWTNPRAVTKAAQFLAKRAILTPDQFAALADQYREAAFTIADVTDADMLTVIRDALAESVSVEEDQAAAVARVHAAFDTAGYDRLAPWHARLVAEMAHSTAYGRAQWETLRDPRVAGILPAFRYQTMEDDRVRPTHAAMNQHVASRDNPIWLTWRPPCGYCCRCRLIGVTVSQWDGVDGEWPSLLGDAVSPDEGFDRAPGAFISGQSEPSLNRRVRDVNRFARKLPAGYQPPAGWRVIAVFEAMTQALFLDLLET